MHTANYEMYIGFADKTWATVAVDVKYKDGESAEEIHKRAEEQTIEQHNECFNIAFVGVYFCNFDSKGVDDDEINV